MLKFRPVCADASKRVVDILHAIKGSVRGQTIGNIGSKHVRPVLLQFEYDYYVMDRSQLQRFTLCETLEMQVRSG
jgi:hypothetical protein